MHEQLWCPKSSATPRLHHSGSGTNGTCVGQRFTFGLHVDRGFPDPSVGQHPMVASWMPTLPSGLEDSERWKVPATRAPGNGQKQSQVHLCPAGGDCQHQQHCRGAAWTHADPWQDASTPLPPKLLEIAPCETPHPHRGRRESGTARPDRTLKQCQVSARGFLCCSATQSLPWHEAGGTGMLRKEQVTGRHRGRQRHIALTHWILQT